MTLRGAGGYHAYNSTQERAERHVTKLAAMKAFKEIKSGILRFQSMLNQTGLRPGHGDSVIVVALVIAVACSFNELTADITGFVRS